MTESWASALWTEGPQPLHDRRTPTLVRLGSTDQDYLLFVLGDLSLGPTEPVRGRRPAMRYLQRGVTPAHEISGPSLLQTGLLPL